MILISFSSSARFSATLRVSQISSPAPTVFFAHLLDALELEGAFTENLCASAAPCRYSSIAFAQFQGFQQGVGAGRQTALQNDRRKGDITAFVFG